MDIASRAIRRTFATLLAAAAAAVAFVACSSSDTSTAKASVPFTAEDGRFATEFPGSPQREENKVSAAGLDLVVVSYSTETDDESVMVGYTDYPIDMGGEGVLDGAAEGSASNVNGTIESTTDLTFLGQPAKDVVVKTSEATVHERIFLVENRLYTLIGVARSGRPTAYDRLLETFNLLPA